MIERALPIPLMRNHSPNILSLLMICLTTAVAAAQPDMDRRRQRILTEGQAEFWRLRDPREVLTLDRVTDPRAAWARIELLARQDPAGSLEAAEVLLTDTVATLRREAESRVNALRGGEGAPWKYNTPVNGGWTPDAETFGNDPLYWEFDILPAAPRSIGLAGLWRFDADAKDVGVKQGYARPGFNDRDWRLVYAPSKHGWERQGAPNYDGVAWYRKHLHIPAAWKNQTLRLHVGEVRGNFYWVAVNGQFLIASDREGSAATHIDIPAKLVRPGETNILAIRVMNLDGGGGLLGPDLRLSVVGSEPGVGRFTCGAGVARQVVHRTKEMPTIVAFASALSPGAVATTTQAEMHLGGWTARGYRAPRWCTFVSRGGMETIDLNETGSIDPRNLDENWMLLWDNRPFPDTARPVMLVLERRPSSIVLDGDGFGGRAVQLSFAAAGARVAMIRPFAAIFSARLTEEQAVRCRLWSRALVKYPIGVVEQATPEDAAVRVNARYEYLDLKDDWGTTPIALAPVPVRHDDGVKAETELTDLGCRSTGGYLSNSDTGNYFAAVGRTEITYKVPR